MHIGTGWILLLVRVAIAAAQIRYGWPKVKDLNSNVRDFAKMGFRPPWLWGNVVAGVEFFGGLAMLLGLWGELAAALFGFEMLMGLFWKIKKGQPFSDYSYDLQLFALCMVVMSQGTGSLAVKSFPGYLFLRWDVALVAVASAFLVTALRPPAPKPSQQVAS